MRLPLEGPPHGRELLGVLGDVGRALGGERQRLPRAVVVGLHQPLVVQQLDGRVDRAGARTPGTSAALGDLLDDLVAVDRLGAADRRVDPHHVEDRGAYVAAAGPGAASLLVGRAEAEEAGDPRRRALPAGAVPSAEVAPRSAAAAAPPLASSGLVLASPLSVEAWVSHLGTPSLCLRMSVYIASVSRYIVTVRRRVDWGKADSPGTR